MSTLTILLGMALVTYLPRLMGFLLSGRQVSPFWLRFLHFVPLTVFAAIIVPALPGSSSDGFIRGVTAVLAGFSVWKFKRLWIGIVVGMGAFWLLRVLH
jgi:branched-subunit amino acid transport protein